MKYKGAKQSIIQDILSFMGKSNVQPNVLVMVCSHSEFLTGDIVHSPSKANYNASPISDVSLSLSAEPADKSSSARF